MSTLLTRSAFTHLRGAAWGTESQGFQLDMRLPAPHWEPGCPPPGSLLPIRNGTAALGFSIPRSTPVARQLTRLQARSFLPGTAMLPVGSREPRDRGRQPGSWWGDPCLVSSRLPHSWLGVGSQEARCGCSLPGGEIRNPGGHPCFQRGDLHPESGHLPCSQQGAGS